MAVMAIVVLAAVLAGCRRKQEPVPAELEEKAPAPAVQVQATPSGPDSDGVPGIRPHIAIEEVLEKERPESSQGRDMHAKAKAFAANALSQVAEKQREELVVATRERHDAELRARESDPTVKESYEAYMQKRDEYYATLKANPDYRQAMQKEEDSFRELERLRALANANKQETQQ
jgi:hypothetical protein